MFPPAWGPVYWMTLHVFALYTPCTDLTTIQSFVHGFCESLPCPGCKSHALQYVKEFPPTGLSGTSFFEYTVNFHNEVNVRLSKSVYGLVDARSAVDAYIQDREIDTGALHLSLCMWAPLYISSRYHRSRSFFGDYTRAYMCMLGKENQGENTTVYHQYRAQGLSMAKSEEEFASLMEQFVTPIAKYKELQRALDIRKEDASRIHKLEKEIEECANKNRKIDHDAILALLFIIFGILLVLALKYIVFNWVYMRNRYKKEHDSGKIEKLIFDASTT